MSDIPAEIKQEISAAMDRLKESMPGYRPRRAQLEMIAQVTRTLMACAEEQEAHNTPISIISAECGVGKSLAYLMPSLICAEALGKHVVVATGTVALQEQLINKDLPQLQASTGLEFTYNLVKGRGRYLCKSKLSNLTGYSTEQRDILFEQDEPEEAPVNIFGTMSELLKRGVWNGEKDSLPVSVEDQEWRRVTNDANGCSNDKCRFYNECEFFEARKRAENAMLLVVNHDLLLADLALGGGKLLPEPSDCILIIDEVHQLPEKALSHFASRGHVGHSQPWLDAAVNTFSHVANLASDIGKGMQLVDDFQESVEAVRGYLSDMYSFIVRMDAFRDAATNLVTGENTSNVPSTIVHRFKDGEIDESLAMICEQAAIAIRQGIMLLGRANLILNDATKSGRGSAGEIEKLTAEIGEAMTRFEGAEKLYVSMSVPDKKRLPPTARWVSGYVAGNGQMEFVIETSPISAAGHLGLHLWGSYASVVGTSATVQTLGTFDRFLRRAGLVRYDNVTTLALSSPFDFANRSVLHVPMMNNEPGAKDAFTAEVVQRLQELVNLEEGTLVLFCSYWQMKETLAGLPKHITDMVLMQGEMSRDELLQKHAARIGAGQGSIVFGVSAFAEGLDLKGDLCRHVVVTKLPFKVPDSPIEEATSEWLESKGKNPFMELSVPDASLKLVQASGRLLRTETDQGRVTILDRRVVTKRYGQLLLDCLPPYRRMIDSVMPAEGYRPPAKAA